MSKKRKSASERNGGEAPENFGTITGLGSAMAQSKPPLTITPQCTVALQQDGALTIERIGSSTQPYRDRTVLTQANAYSVLMDYLSEKAGEIELERQLAQDRLARTGKRHRAQPNWRLIARHPQAEIRQGLTEASLCAKGSITVCPPGSGLTGLKADRTLDEMGL